MTNLFSSYRYDDVRETFREEVLTALDKAAKKYTGETNSGWTDQDLPEFFKALDAQIERIAERNNIALLDPIEAA